MASFHQALNTGKLNTMEIIKAFETVFISLVIIQALKIISTFLRVLIYFVMNTVWMLYLFSESQ
jgi:hypothetical protein